MKNIIEPKWREAAERLRQQQDIADILPRGNQQDTFSVWTGQAALAGDKDAVFVFLNELTYNSDTYTFSDDLEVQHVGFEAAKFAAVQGDLTAAADILIELTSDRINIAELGVLVLAAVYPLPPDAVVRFFDDINEGLLLRGKKELFFYSALFCENDDTGTPYDFWEHVIYSVLNKHEKNPKKLYEPLTAMISSPYSNMVFSEQLYKAFLKEFAEHMTFSDAVQAIKDQPYDFYYRNLPEVLSDMILSGFLKDDEKIDWDELLSIVFEETDDKRLDIFSSDPQEERQAALEVLKDKAPVVYSLWEREFINETLHDITTEKQKNFPSRKF